MLRRPAFRVSCLAVLLACGGCATGRDAASDMRDAVTPESGPRIDEIRYEGLDTLSRADLRPFLLTDRRGRWPWSRKVRFDRLSVEEDAGTIADVYQTRGFFEAQVDYEIDESEDGVIVTFRVQEGPPVQLGEVSIEWTEPPPEGVATLDLPLHEGDRFELEHYREAKEKLLTALANQGRPSASIEGGVDVDLSLHRAHLRWTVDPGPRVRFGEIRVRGDERVDASLIAREASQLEGELFSRDALLDAQRRVFSLGLFEAVQVQARPDPDAPERNGSDAKLWPVTVTVTEREPRTIEAGLGYGTEEQVRTKLSWTHRNLLGGGQHLYLLGRYSSLNRGVESKLSQPRFLEPEVSLDLQASLLRELRPNYNVDRARVSVELARNLSNTLAGRIGWSLERNDVTGVSDATLILAEDAEDIFLLSQLFARLDRDATDSLIEPTHGSRARLELTLSPTALGSGFDFTKAEAEARVYRSVESIVFAARLMAGVIQPFGTTAARSVPLVSRFFSGGSNSVRGYPYQELGPVDAANEPVGGTTLTEANLEMRFPLWREIRGVVFADAGQVALDPFRWRPEDVFYSIGVGLRASTPVGPLRIDVGHPLNPAQSIDKLRLHLSIGQAF